jgi:hypothetical protein
MRTLLVVGALVCLVVLPSTTPGAPLDSSKPVLCALTSVIECSQQGKCEHSTADGANVPAFVRVNTPERVLSTVDGARTSPIAGLQRENGRLMIQGMQNARAWSAVINEETGQLAATVAEADGAIVIAGACTVP